MFRCAAYREVEYPTVGGVVRQGRLELLDDDLAASFVTGVIAGGHRLSA